MSRAQKRRLLSDSEKREKYNSAIAEAIAGVVRFSLDDDFRSQCYSLMQVDNTNDMQCAIRRKLDALTNVDFHQTNAAPVAKRLLSNVEERRTPGQDLAMPGPSGVKRITQDFSQQQKVDVRKSGDDSPWSTQAELDGITNDGPDRANLSPPRECSIRYVDLNKTAIEPDLALPGPSGVGIVTKDVCIEEIVQTNAIEELQDLIAHVDVSNAGSNGTPLSDLTNSSINGNKGDQDVICREPRTTEVTVMKTTIENNRIPNHDINHSKITDDSTNISLTNEIIEEDIVWPTEGCLWGPDLQEEINCPDLNDDDTEWK